MSYPSRAEIEQLSTDERLRLIEDVWDTFESAPESLAVSDEHRAVLEDRLAKLESNPEATISWDEVRRRLRKAS